MCSIKCFDNILSLMFLPIFLDMYLQTFGKMAVSDNRVFLRTSFEENIISHAMPFGYKIIFSLLINLLHDLTKVKVNIAKQCQSIFETL